MSIVDVPSGYSEATSAAGGTAYSFSLPAKNHHAGNTLTVCIRIDGSSSVTVTDTAGNTYTEIATVGVSITTSRVRIFYCFNAIGNASNSVSINVSGTTGFATAQVWETSGLGTGVVLATSAANTPSGSPSTAIDAGPLTYSAQPSIVFGAMVASNNGMSGGPGFTFTLVTDGFGGFEGSEFQIVASTVNATATVFSSLWAANSVAFGIAGVGGGGLLFNQVVRSNRRGKNPAKKSSGTFTIQRAPLIPVISPSANPPPPTPWFFRNRRRMR